MGLHPRKYVKHVLEDVTAFIEGKMDYPEIDLKLGGEEAWLDAYPPLRDLTHAIEQQIHNFGETYRLDEGGTAPSSAWKELIDNISPYLDALYYYYKTGQLPPDLSKLLPEYRDYSGNWLNI